MMLKFNIHIVLKAYFNMSHNSQNIRCIGKSSQMKWIQGIYGHFINLKYIQC